MDLYEAEGFRFDTGPSLLTCLILEKSFMNVVRNFETLELIHFLNDADI